MLLCSKTERIITRSNKLLDDIYMYTGQSDIADVIVSRRRNFVCNAQQSHNVVVRNLATATL